MGEPGCRVAGIGSELYNSAFKDLNNILAVGFNNALKYTAKNVCKVAFNLNTATVPDTLPVAGSKIHLRGGANAGGYSPITWGNDAQNEMTAVGGDYWRKTVYMQAGDTLRYKYVIAYASGTGWEKGVVPADFPSATGADRSLIVPNKDTTLNVEFWNNGAGTRAQNFRPWPATPDSFINVYFRVSMAGQIASGTPNYNNDKDTVAVRGGGGYVGADLDWGRSTYLTRESAPTDGDGYTVAPTNFWSARLRFRKRLRDGRPDHLVQVPDRLRLAGERRVAGPVQPVVQNPGWQERHHAEVCLLQQRKTRIPREPRHSEDYIHRKPGKAAGSGGIDVLNDTL